MISSIRSFNRVRENCVRIPLKASLLYNVSSVSQKRQEHPMAKQQRSAQNVVYLDQFQTQKEPQTFREELTHLPDELSVWIACYLRLAVPGSRNEDGYKKVVLLLGRFEEFFRQRYRQGRLSICRQVDVEAWLTEDLEERRAFSPATINSHLPTLSRFCSWVHAQRSELFVLGNPTSRLKERSLPPIEPQTLSNEQIILLKNLCDRLPRFHEKKGWRYQAAQRKAPGRLPQLHCSARPWRGAVIYLLLATGLRREELVELDLAQLVLGSQVPLRQTRKAARRRGDWW